MLAVAPWTGEEVVELAFREAAERRTRLLVVRVWNDPLIDLGRLVPDRMARWDAAADSARAELEAAVSARRVIHPEVQVECWSCRTARPTSSSRSPIGPSSSSSAGPRGALLAGLAGSPVAALQTRASCPVMVVPADGPPRRTWLPRRGTGLAQRI